MNLSLSQKVFALVTVPLTLCLAILLILSVSLENAATIARQEARSRRVRGEGAMVALQLDNILNAVNQRLLGASDLESQCYAATIHDALGQINTSLSSLQEACKENRAQNQIMKTRVQPLYEALRAECVAASTKPAEDPRSLWTHMQILRAEIVRVASLESRNTDTRVSTEVESIETARTWLAYAALLLVFATVGWVLSFARHMVGRLQALKENTVRLANHQTLLPVTKGSDELAEVDRSFHTMAEQLAEYVRKEQAVIENAKEVICKLDSNRRFLKVNPASSDILGYAPAEMEGRPLSDFIPSGASTTELDRLVGQADSQASFEIEMTRKNQTEAVLLWTVHWSNMDDALFCVLHDITERKRLEQVKQEFVSMVSHDLRAPLMSIQGALTLLHNGVYGQLSDRAIQSISTAETNCVSLIRLVNQILDMEKLAAGQLTILREQVTTGLIISRAMSMIAHLAEKQSVRITVEDDNYEFYADEDRLVQVLVNLLSNAIKYSPIGGIITLSTEIEDEQLQFQVQDHGRGISPALQSTVFERFRQVDINDSRKLGGTGLGLAICKSIVCALGGSIGVISEEGKGSTFWFRIPMNYPATETTVKSL